MGGIIAVTSIKGAGTTFEITTPFTAAQEGGKAVVNYSAGGKRLLQSGTIAESRLAATIEEQAEVMVVEDNMVNQRLIFLQLKKTGTTCTFSGK